MSDRVVLKNMQFMGRHGVLEEEQLNAQPFEVDVELVLDLQAAAREDDLAWSVDYRDVFDICREIVESTTYRLLEALAEAIAHESLARFAVDEVVVRVRKPKVRLGGPLDYASVEITRVRAR